MRIPPPIGFPLLPTPDESGQLRWPRLERSVEDAVRVVLSTRPGEQLMRPDFGAGLDRFLHEPDSVETRRRIHDAVLESLRAWEPRIALSRVEVGEVPSRPGHLRVEITYSLLRNGESRRLGLTVRTGV